LTFPPFFGNISAITSRNRRVNQPNQLALMLFDTIAKDGKSVAEAPTALGYRRSNAFIGISM
jgi:ATP-dependent DNA ligase